MKRIEEYLPKEEDNDRMIQKELREIDHETLINLCTYWGSQAELLYRNLSRRVYELAKADVEERKISIPEFRQEAAYVLFQRKLLKYERKRVVEDNERMSSLCFDTRDEIRRSLGYIYRLNKSQDIEKMELLKRGILSMLSGDPAEIFFEKLDD